MSDHRKIEPLKVFVRYVPKDTTVDELKIFFSTCGNVKFASIVLPKHFNYPQATYIYGFVLFQTQQEVDRAVGELNGKIFTNKKGISATMVVTHCYLKSNVEGSSDGKFRLPCRENHLENRQPDQKNRHQDTDRNELWQRYEANEEKLKQIYHDPAVEQELKDLKMKMDQLQVRNDDLEAKVQSLRGENEILELTLQLKELDQEQIKLKSMHT